MLNMNLNTISSKWIKKWTLLILVFSFLSTAQAKEITFWTSTLLNHTSSLVSDSIPPTASLSTGSMTVEGAFDVLILFSEEVTDLTAEDFELNNGLVELVGG